MAQEFPHGLGRRKTAVAQVLLLSESTDRTVNSKTFVQYFPLETQQAVILRPLILTSQETHGFKVKVLGGGQYAQAEAIALAIAHALLAIDEGFRKQLKAAGLLSRDSRKKERKKPGLKRARRAPQFSKR